MIVTTLLLAAIAIMFFLSLNTLLFVVLPEHKHGYATAFAIFFTVLLCLSITLYYRML